jgi:hypothetical protein
MNRWRLGVKTVRCTARALWVAGFCCAATLAASSQELPTTEQFDGSVKECAVNQNILLRADLIGAIVSIYSAERPKGAPSFRSAAVFVALMPEGDARLEAYRLYAQCIASIILGLVQTAPAGPKVLTCYAQRDMSGEMRLADQIMPLNCPFEVEQGSGFLITGSYACGGISKKSIVYDEQYHVPVAVLFDMHQNCIHGDNHPDQAKAACTRSDNHTYSAAYSCFVVSFHTQ